MLGRLNHVAIAVKDAEKAAKIYGGAFGAEISGAVPLPEHGVITVFVTLPNTKIEFIQPLGDRQIRRAQCRRRHSPHLL
jgi:methylmalonyl-CoA/ethylmalonyl-CoA epimerase